MQTDLYKYKTEPYEHQIDAVKFVATESPDFFALFMEQGTGKTKTTIDIACNYYLAGRLDAILLIAPNGVHEQWYREELPKHYSVPMSLFLWHSSAAYKKKMEAWMQQTKEKKSLKVACVNVEAFSYATYIELFRDFLCRGRTLIVIDEATCIKNPTAKRTVNIVNGLSDCQYRGKRIVKRTPLSKYRAILTGTPETKGPYDLWSLFDFLQENYFGLNYYAFKARYGMEKQVFFPGMVRAVQKPLEPSDFKGVRRRYAEGMSVGSIASEMSLRMDDVQYIIDNPDVLTPYKNLGELKAKVAEHAFIVKKEDCLDLPTKIYQKVLVEMSPDQKALYKSMIAQAFAVYQRHELTAQNKISIQIRLRQIAGGFFPANAEVLDGLGLTVALEETVTKPIGVPPKVKAILAELEETTSFPVIIATAFRSEADYMYSACKEAGYKTVQITGGVGKEERQEAVEAYKSGEAEVLIATTMTIARGYNFQNGSTMLIYSNSYRTEDRLQLEDRIHRIGQEGVEVEGHEGVHVLYKDFICKNSIDETIMEVLEGDKAFLDYMRSDDPTDFFKLIGANTDVKEVEVTNL